eukprot:3864584-Amphidinium_carterae.2
MTPVWVTRMGLLPRVGLFQCRAHAARGPAAAGGAVMPALCYSKRMTALQSLYTLHTPQSGYVIL